MNLLCLVKLEFVNIDDFCVFIHLLGEKKPSVKHRETIVNAHIRAWTPILDRERPVKLTPPKSSFFWFGVVDREQAWTSVNMEIWQCSSFYRIQVETMCHIAFTEDISALGSRWVLLSLMPLSADDALRRAAERVNRQVELENALFSIQKRLGHDIDPEHEQYAWLSVLSMPWSSANVINKLYWTALV